ncbi:MAG: sugar ABC transporter permease [Bacilli bacterium]
MKKILKKIGNFFKIIGNFFVKIGKSVAKVAVIIGQFFAKYAVIIANFFVKLWKIIKKGLKKFFNTRAMKKTGYVLSWVPNWINDRLNNKQRKAVWGMIFIIPLLVGFVYFFLIPFILTVQYSFSYVAKFDGQEGLTTIFVGFNNYTYVFKEFTTYIDGESSVFTALLLKSFWSMLSDLPIILIFSLLIAVVLNSKFKLRALVRAIFFMPVIFNSTALDIAAAGTSGMSAVISAAQTDIFAQMFSFEDFLLNANIPVGMVGVLTNVSDKIYDILAYSGIQILIFLSAIQSVPRHLYEAAKMEGATSYEMFWKITFPMVSPMLLTTAVYTIVDSYTRSMMVSRITAYTNAKSTTTTLGEGLSGKALDIYNSFQSGADVVTGSEYAYLSNYGIGAALSMMYALMVIILMLIVLGLLSKMVFYYDK